MMDATYTSVIRLWEQQCSQKEIARRLDLSPAKVRKILITAGHYKTLESIMLAEGATPEQIATMLGKSLKAVNGNLPYSKGMYDAEYPSLNALRIRENRKKNKEVTE